MMLAFGRCRRLVVVTIEVSDGNNDCTDAADVGEDVLTLLLDASSPPSPSSPSLLSLLFPEKDVRHDVCCCPNILWR